MRAAMIVLGVSVAIAGGVHTAAAQQGQVRSRGNVTVLNVPTERNGAQIDFANAKAMPLPQGFAPADQVQALLSLPAAGEPGFSPGASGDGRQNPVSLGTAPVVAEDEGIEPQEFGTSNHPFSTARADLNTLATNTQWPYSASGKLFFNIGTASYVCSASLIKRGVIVTAAHCVSNYGQRQFYANWRFVPGYRNGSGPFQTWTAYQAWVMTSYFNGTDGCYQYGVICPNDVAVIILNTNNSSYPGASTGWYGYGWNNYGFAGTLTHITQTGYPVCLDNGLFMERNDSHGYIYSTFSNNTIIGSLMCGGSSGGPWLVNFGIRPTLSSTTAGTAASPNVVVGVTSWGYIDAGVKQQGASPFTSNNIVPLVNSACTSRPAACS